MVTNKYHDKDFAKKYEVIVSKEKLTFIKSLRSASRRGPKGRFWI